MEAKDRGNTGAILGLSTGPIRNPKPPQFGDGFFGPFKYVLYFWYSSVLKLGYKRTLQYDDVFDTPDALKTDSVYPGFKARFDAHVAKVEADPLQGEAILDKARDGKTAKFVLHTIWHQHKVRILYAMLLQLFYAAVQFAGPLLLKEITQFLTRADVAELSGGDVPSSEVTKAWFFALGMFLAPVVGTLAAGQSNRMSIGTQIMIRAELIAAIYRKSLSLSTRSRQATETGRVVNLMSADVNQLQSFFYPFAAQLLTGPATLITALILLWFQIKWATFIGLGILMLSTPATIIFLKKVTGYRREMLKYTDQRVKLMNQLLVGIRVLKMYAWEAAQEAVVLEVRRQELGELRKAIPMRVGMQALLFAAPTLAMVVSFLVYGSANPDAFQPANVFTAISLFALMRFPLIFLPFALIQLGNALISMRRLTQYFMLEDRKDQVQEGTTAGIEIVDGEFYWADPPPKIVMPEVGRKKGKKKGGAPAAAAGKVAPTTGAASPAAVKGAVTNGDVESGRQTPTSEDAATDDSGSSPPQPTAPAAAGIAAAAAEGEEAASTVAVALPGMAVDAAGSVPPSKGVAWRLHDVNLTVGPGELVCVVGRVGSGKTSLVQAILGEMEVSSGKVAVGGSLAYAAQQAWIINASVKENVSFGRPFEQDRWEHCVESCCLTADLEVLPAGADTEIGEKGINLSGGQKQRISLARALYQDADVYILDDPLSAVDVHVGRHIFENFIDGAIASKARLLVTNQLQYLPYANKVVVIDGGRVVAHGSLEECNKNEMFARLLAEHNSQVGDVADAANDAEKAAGGRKSLDKGAVVVAKPSAAAVAAEAAAAAAAAAAAKKKMEEAAVAVARDAASIERRELADVVASVPGVAGRQGTADVRLERGATFARLPSMFGGGRSKRGAAAGDAMYRDKSGKYGAQLTRMETMKVELAKKGGKRGKGKVVDASPSGKLIVKEDQEVGQVTGRVYWKYIQTYGVFSFFFLILMWSAEQSVRILTNWYLSRWTAAEVNASYERAAGLDDSFDRWDFMGGYLGLALGFVGLTAIRSYSNLMSALRASRLVHLSTLSSLVRAPVTFFDTTPVGRILNRFSKDTDEVDFLLSMSMTEFGNCIMQLLATLIFLSVVQPIILAGIMPLMIIYYFLQRYYRRSYIEMQRLDAVSRSPIYAHFSESLSGVETIRAYRLADAFAASSDARVDSNHRAYFTARMANEWLTMRLDIIGACIVFLTAMLAIVRRDIITASLAALTLSEALDVTLFLKSAVTSGAMFESRFNSVERLIAYWDLPQEAPAQKPDVSPEEEWPAEGAVRYEDVWMRYRPELDPILKGVSFEVSPGDKVGIVGRTGSGKSSLIVTLFRLVEPFQGRIIIDGVNILELGLDDVRGRIAAIPQDPVLFSGSVRSNLDPYSKHSDAELWDALGHVALKEVVGALPEGLSARVAEGGENFSVGQRQLLCVARALLRNPRVLVADEATASVDSETDALIQRTIRREFKHCTVLTIAHRINTVLDSTRVLVMEDGNVAEYDTVPTLMGRRQSTFRAMVMQAGLEGENMSRSASAASLAESDDGSKLKKGFNTFAKRLEDKFDLK